MRITTGKVRGGAVDLEGEVLPEGSIATVIASDDEEAFELGPDKEADLIAAMEEADRDQTVVVRQRELTHAQAAKLARTSRTRITGILNRSASGVSTDLLLRILASLGYRARIVVTRAA